MTTEYDSQRDHHQQQHDQHDQRRQDPRDQHEYDHREQQQGSDHHDSRQTDQRERRNQDQPEHDQREQQQRHDHHDRRQVDQRERRNNDQYDRRQNDHHAQRHYDQYDHHHQQQQHSQRAQRPYDQRDQQLHDQREQQPQQRSMALERGRAIRLMRNGDSFFSGRAFVINQRKYPMLDVFLDDASQALHANFGAVRCIYTPKHGTRLRDISELEDHRTYVAAGSEKFKRLEYYDIAEGRRVQIKDRTPPKLPPVRRFDVEGRALKLSRSENVIIYVYRNGDQLTLPVKILLVKPTLQNWESVLDEVTRKISLTTSAVLKLYAMNGELVTSAQQLEYNGMYVAAGKERFKRIEYPDPKSFSPNSSPKMSRKSDHTRVKLPIKQQRVGNYNEHQPLSDMFNSKQNRYTKSDGTNTHTTATANSHGSNDRNRQRRPVREEYDFFNSKPHQPRRGPTKETDLDRDDGGIYKGRLNYRERVREVDDTRDTKVDLPVDYREIETVEDEQYYGNAAKAPRRQEHQPPNQPKINQAVANSRQRSPPMLPRIIPPKKDYDDDNNDYNNNSNDHNNKVAMNNGHQRSNNQHQKNHNGSNNDHHRRLSPTPRQTDDEMNDDHGDHEISHSHRREKSVAPNSQAANEGNNDHAATVIQSHVRGYLTRKQAHHEKEQNTNQLTNNHDQQQQQYEAHKHIENELDQKQHEAHKHTENELDQHRYSPEIIESENSMLKALVDSSLQQAMTEVLSGDGKREEEKKRRHDDNDDDNV